MTAVTTTAPRRRRVGSAYPNNIRVGTVKARGGGRGVFCVSESGGATDIRWSPCSGSNNTISNVTRVNSTLSWC
ncbi:hypothetical protein [Nonomuraea sp. NEAU-A123]|uniref:hypothetical protein n=1 Tax=Nonomuraea sp. NEAU-A123 TaxID=2839649 RepID=UPI0035ABAFF5